MASSVTETAVSYAGMRTRELAVVGVSPTVVFLHGYLDSADTWRGVLEVFPFAAVAVDLPGFGSADDLGAGEILPQLDRFVDGILDALGPVVLVGNSLGAYSSIKAASRRPAEVLAVVAAASPELVGGGRARITRSRLAGVAAFGFGQFVHVPSWVIVPVARRVMPWLLYGNPAVADREVIRRWEHMFASTCRADRIPGELVTLARETLKRSDYRAITAPVMVVHGRQDRVVPLKAGRELHSTMPESRFVVLDDGGHCPQHDDPDRFAMLVTDFIGEHIDARRSGSE